MDQWTKNEKEKILMELEKRDLPFKKYRFSKNGTGLCLLGRGASAEVYETESRRNPQKKFAVKVIGFREKHSDSEAFQSHMAIYKNIAEIESDVVNVYASKEVWITFDEQEEILEVFSEKPDGEMEKCLQLQFILMEKLTCIFSRDKTGKIHLFPQKLEEGDENEIIKLARDIGLALERIHKEKILHRDIKLENIFYSSEKKQYKLGDFGIAAATSDGMASTIAFTKGYGAPEVLGVQNDRYDSTADIYSFGMTLFVLANHLKFPGSDSYSVNYGEQYRSGYILPCPDAPISEKMYQIMQKACRYEPDDRYQSMEEMLKELDKVTVSEVTGYRADHIRGTWLMGMFLLTVGVAVWKLTAKGNTDPGYLILEYILLGCGIGSCFRWFRGENKTKFRLLGFWIGMARLYYSGISWKWLMISLIIAWCSGSTAGYVSVGMLTADLVSRLQRMVGMENMIRAEYRWIAVTAISLSFVLFLQFQIINFRDPSMVRLYFEKRIFWPVICADYGVMAVQAIQLHGRAALYYRKLLGDKIVDAMLRVPVDLFKVGIVGLLFCAAWLVREKIMMKRREEK